MNEKKLEWNRNMETSFKQYDLIKMKGNGG